MNRPTLVRVGELPFFERSLAAARERFAHCTFYPWERVGDVMLPVARRPVELSTGRELAIAIHTLETSRTLHVVPGGGK